MSSKASRRTIELCGYHEYLMAIALRKKNATCVVRKQEIIITIVDNVNSLQCDRAAFCLPRATPRIFPRLAHTARTKPFHASNALELALISRFFLCLHARPKAIKKNSFFHCFRIAQCR